MGNFWKHMDYFLFQHLVTLVAFERTAVLVGLDAFAAAAVEKLALGALDFLQLVPPGVVVLDAVVVHPRLAVHVERVRKFFTQSTNVLKRNLIITPRTLYCLKCFRLQQHLRLKYPLLLLLQQQHPIVHRQHLIVHQQHLEFHQQHLPHQQHQKIYQYLSINNINYCINNIYCNNNIYCIINI